MLKMDSPQQTLDQVYSTATGDVELDLPAESPPAEVAQEVPKPQETQAQEVSEDVGSPVEESVPGEETFEEERVNGLPADELSSEGVGSPLTDSTEVGTPTASPPQEEAENVGPEDVDEPVELQLAERCSICLHELHTPRSLPCLHMFCDNCIMHVLSMKTVNAQFQCPQCRVCHAVPREGSAGFRISFYHENFSDELDHVRKISCQCSFCDKGEKGSYVCIICCEILCKECETVHQKHKSTKNHPVQAITESNQQEISLQIRQKQSKLIKCQTHCDEEAKFFCDQLQQEICYLCVFSQEHVNHDVKYHGTVDDKYKEFTEQLETLSEQLIERLKSTEGKLVELKNLKLEIECEAARFKDQVEERRDELVKIVYNIADERIQNAHGQQQKNINIMAAGVSQLMMVYSSCRDSIQKIRHNDTTRPPLSDIISLINDVHSKMLSSQPTVHIDEIERKCCKSVLALPILPTMAEKKNLKHEFGSVKLVSLATQKQELTQASSQMKDSGIGNNSTLHMVTSSSGSGEDLSVDGECPEDPDDENRLLTVQSHPKLNYRYKKFQWSPINLEGKKQYDREFLLQFQFIREKPEDFLDIPEIMRHNSSKPFKPMLDKLDFTPAYFKIPNAQQQRPSLGPRGSRGGGSQSDCGRIIQVQEKKERTTLDTDAAKTELEVELHHASNPYQPKKKNERATVDSDEDKTDDILRNFRAILNKLTPQKFTKLVDQAVSIVDEGVDNEFKLTGIINVIYKQAVDDPVFQVMYANFCQVLCQKNIKVPVEDRETSFKGLLLSRFQYEFENDKAEYLTQEQERYDAEIAAAETEEKKQELTIAHHDAILKARKRSLGNFRFIGELFKLGLFTAEVMHQCIMMLLKKTDEDSLECLCRLLMTVGGMMDKEVKVKDHMTDYMNQLEMVMNDKGTSTRIRFFIMHVMETRRNNWTKRRVDGWRHRWSDAIQPKTIDQIHKEAAEEKEKNQKKSKKTKTAKQRSGPLVDEQSIQSGLANKKDQATLRIPTLTITNLTRQQNVSEDELASGDSSPGTLKEGQLDVFVRYKNQTFSVQNIPPDVNMDEFQKTVVENLKNPLNASCLHYGGRVLKSSTQLKDFGIVNNSTLPTVVVHQPCQQYSQQSAITTPKPVPFAFTPTSYYHHQCGIQQQAYYQVPIVRPQMQAMPQAQQYQPSPQPMAAPPQTQMPPNQDNAKDKKKKKEKKVERAHPVQQQRRLPPQLPQKCEKNAYYQVPIVRPQMQAMPQAQQYQPSPQPMAAPPQTQMPLNQEKAKEKKKKKIPEKPKEAQKTKEKKKKACVVVNPDAARTEITRSLTQQPNYSEDHLASGSCDPSIDGNSKSRHARRRQRQKDREGKDTETGTQALNKQKPPRQRPSVVELEPPSQSQKIVQDLSRDNDIPGNSKNGKTLVDSGTKLFYKMSDFYQVKL